MPAMRTGLAALNCPYLLNGMARLPRHAFDGLLRQMPQGEMRKMTGFSKHSVGDIEVIVLEDGHSRAPNSLFPLHDMEKARAAAAQAGDTYDGETAYVPINAFVIRAGDTVAIVDAGSPPDYLPTTGGFPNALAAAGVAPDEVTHLIMTHLHVDHVGGMVDAAGNAVFANAELVSGQGEWDHFQNDDFMGKLGKRALASFMSSRRAITPYADRRRDISGETEVVPGISMIPLPGHTPGHSGVHITDGDQQLLIWGDTIHSETFQMAEPDWGVLFDVDGDQARATRKRIFDRVASDGLTVTGPHVRGPGFCQVERMKQGYRLVRDT